MRLLLLGASVWVFLIVPFRHQQGQSSNGDLTSRHIFLRSGPLNSLHSSLSLRMFTSKSRLKRKDEAPSHRGYVCTYRFNPRTSSTLLSASSSHWFWPFQPESPWQHSGSQQSALKVTICNVGGGECCQLTWQAPHDELVNSHLKLLFFIAMTTCFCYILQFEQEFPLRLTAGAFSIQISPASVNNRDVAHSGIGVPEKVLLCGQNHQNRAGCQSCDAAQMQLVDLTAGQKTGLIKIYGKNKCPAQLQTCSVWLWMRIVWICSKHQWRRDICIAHPEDTAGLRGLWWSLDVKDEVGLSPEMMCTQSFGGRRRFEWVHIGVKRRKCEGFRTDRVIAAASLLFAQAQHYERVIYS